MRRILVALLGIVGFAAAARAADAVRLDYDLYAAGLNAARVRVGAGLQPDRYLINIGYRTTGIVGFFFSGHQLTTVRGNWMNNRPEPVSFLSQGAARGEERLTHMDYDRGLPVLRRLTPPNEVEREPVPTALQANTIDTLSALAGLMRSVAATGRCEGEVRTYDGRRAAIIRIATIGEEVLPKTARSSFSGSAMRCDFVSQMVGGFYHGDTIRKPLTGSLWLAAAIPGAPNIPVRMTFETRWIGDAMLYLTDARASAEPGIGVY